MMALSKRIAALEAAKGRAWKRVRRVILREGEPDPVSEPGELLVIRRIIKREAA